MPFWLGKTQPLVYLSQMAITQWEQYQHHVLLANLRRRTTSSTTRQTKENEHPQQQPIKTPPYKIPHGGWFEYVICPHYFFEILLYITFGILLYSIEIPIPTTTQPPVVPGDNLVFMLHQLSMYYVYQHRYMVTMSFIVGNLYYSAYEANQWYIHQFGSSYEQLHRKLLIPMIL